MIRFRIWEFGIRIISISDLGLRIADLLPRHRTPFVFKMFSVAGNGIASKAAGKPHNRTNPKSEIPNPKLKNGEVKSPFSFKEDK